MPAQVVGQITKLDDGWVLQWNEGSHAVKTTKELGKLVTKLASKRPKVVPPTGVVGAKPLPWWQPGAIEVPDDPDKVLHNLEVLAKALVNRDIRQEDFERGVAMACPGATPDLVDAALHLADKEYQATWTGGPRSGGPQPEHCICPQCPDKPGEGHGGLCQDCAEGHHEHHLVGAGTDGTE